MMTHCASDYFVSAGGGAYSDQLEDLLHVLSCLVGSVLQLVFHCRKLFGKSRLFAKALLCDMCIRSNEGGQERVLTGHSIYLHLWLCKSLLLRLHLSIASVRMH